MKDNLFYLKLHNKEWLRPPKSGVYFSAENTLLDSSFLFTVHIAIAESMT